MTPEERFWTKVDKSGECWEWTGSRRHEYGQIRWAGRPQIATRVAWLLEHGDLPAADLMVCHSCDNPPCVRPAHLFLGTQADNLRDMRSKGRAPNRGAVGSANTNAVLNDDIVREMRAMYALGATSAALGRQFGVGPSAANAVVNNKTWKHVA